MGCPALRDVHHYTFIETYCNDILSFQCSRDRTTLDGEWVLNGYNCTQLSPLTTAEDTTEYAVANL
jgi:hypothetical protein